MLPQSQNPDRQKAAHLCLQLQSFIHASCPARALETRVRGGEMAVSSSSLVGRRARRPPKRVKSWDGRKCEHGRRSGK